MNVLKNQDFRRIWAGQAVSQLGSQVSVLALPLTALTVLHASAFDVSLLNALQIVPFLLLGLPVGAWVDRTARRPVLIAADLTRALALLTVPVGYELGGLTMAQLYLVALVQGSATVFFDVTYQSYLPDLVAVEQLVDGNAKLELARAGAQLAGPGAGGWLIAAVRAPAAVFADAGSFLFSAFMIRLLPREDRAQTPRPGGARAVSWAALSREVGEGLRFVRRSRLLAPIVGVAGLLNFSYGMISAILVTYSVRVLGFSAGRLGTVMALGALGFVVGAMLARRIAARIGQGRGIVLGALLNGVGPLLIPAAPVSSPEALMVLGLFVQWFGVVLFNVTQISLRQLITPRELLGRVNATVRFVVWGTLPVGSLFAGALASTAGLHPAMWAACGVGAFSFAGVYFSEVRRYSSGARPAAGQAGQARQAQAQAVPEPVDGAAGD
jgi:MFS family permease